MAKLPDYKAYALLKKYGIPIAPFVLAKNIKQAQAAAGKFGYPVVAKIDAEIIHKAKAGCVEVVRNEKELAHAFPEIVKNAKKRTQKISGILIQPFIEGAELIVGGKRDATFDTIVMFGSGGVLADVLKDVTFRVLPIDRLEAELMVQETKAPAAIPALASQANQVAGVILRVARLLEANPKITELDINPLFLTTKGPLAADVRIVEK